MKKKSKNKAKRPKLPKYRWGIGDPVASRADETSMMAEDDSGLYDQPGQYNGPTAQQYQQYGNATAGALGAYGASMAQNPNDQGRAINSGVDVAATSLTPWYGYAKGASEMGKNAIKHDTAVDRRTGESMTVGRTATGQAWRDTFTPMHQTAIEDASSGDFGSAAANVFTGGVYNTLDNYFNNTDRKKYDKINANNAAADATPWVQPEKDRQDAVWQKLNDHVDYKYGGAIPDYAKYPFGGVPNAEVEKQELIRTPDGTATQMDGPSHENGGIPVNIPAKTQIFSDKLKLPGSKKTIAKEAAPYKTGKEAKVLEDESASTMAKNTARLIADAKQKKLDDIFAAQEQFKQEKVMNYAKKLGVTLPQGRPQMRNGGTLPRYDGGGFSTPRGTYDEGLNLIAGPYGQDLNPEASDAERDAQWAVMEANRNNYLPTNSTNPATNTGSPYTPSTSKQAYSPDYTGMTEATVNTLLQNSGNLWDLYQTGFGKKYDRENSGQLTPNLVNPKTMDARESLRDSDRESAASRGALRNAVGGNVGAYMANLTANQVANSVNKAKIRQNIGNMNTGILNQADSTNTGIKNAFAQHNQSTRMLDKSNEQQNKARSEDIARQAIRGLGTNSSAAYRDYKAGKMDQNTASMIGSMFSDYKLNMSNPSHWEWVFKTLGGK